VLLTDLYKSWHLQAHNSDKNIQIYMYVYFSCTTVTDAWYVESQDMHSAYILKQLNVLWSIRWGRQWQLGFLSIWRPTVTWNFIGSTFWPHGTVFDKAVYNSIKFFVSVLTPCCPQSSMSWWHRQNLTFIVHIDLYISWTSQTANSYLLFTYHWHFVAAFNSEKATTGLSGARRMRLFDNTWSQRTDSI